MLYTPGLITAILFAAKIIQARNPSQTTDLAGAMGAIHFGKRVLESLFLHKYSGGMELAMVIPGCISYSICIAQVAFFSRPASLLSPTSVLGISLFVIGTLGNLYHHWLLRNLRTGNEKKRYVVPRGGLFEYVACPHYLFELIAWLGMGVYGRAANCYVPFVAMGGYLMRRAEKTTKYYHEKLGEEYPKDRRHLIPFIY